MANAQQVTEDSPTGGLHLPAAGNSSPALLPPATSSQDIPAS